MRPKTPKFSKRYGICISRAYWSRAAREMLCVRDAAGWGAQSIRLAARGRLRMGNLAASFFSFRRHATLAPIAGGNGSGSGKEGFAAQGAGGISAPVDLRWMQQLVARHAGGALHCETPDIAKPNGSSEDRCGRRVGASSRGFVLSHRILRMPARAGSAGVAQLIHGRLACAQVGRRVDGERVVVAKCDPTIIRRWSLCQLGSARPSAGMPETRSQVRG